MTKKQRKEIAIHWTATFIHFIDIQMIPEGIDEEDITGIVEEITELGERILGKRPLLLTLPRIIEHVLENK